MARMISANYTIRHECLWRPIRGNQIVYHRRIENRHRRGYETATGENRSSGVRPPSHLRPKVTGEEIRKCSSAKIRSRTVEEKPQKVYHRASEKALRGGYQIAAGKKKSGIRFGMPLCLLLTWRWNLPAGLCTVSQVEADEGLVWDAGGSLHGLKVVYGTAVHADGDLLFGLTDVRILSRVQFVDAILFSHKNHLKSFAPS